MNIEIRQYEVSIFSTLADGWRQLKGGNWKPLLGASLLIFLLQTILVDVPGYFIDKNVILHDSLFTAYAFLIYIFMFSPLNAGFMMLGVHLLNGQRIKTRQIFDYWRLQCIGQLFLLIVWLIVRVSIPLLILWFPVWGMLFFPSVALFLMTVPDIGVRIYMVIAPLATLYLFMRYVPAVPLILENQLSPWPAMTLAVRAFNQHGFRIYLLILIQLIFSMLPGTLLGLVVFVAGYLASSLIVIMFAMPIFTIAMVFMMPWWMTVYGILYQKMFGSETGVVAHAGS